MTSRLRLLKLIPEIQDMIAKGRVSEGHVKQLLKLDALISRHIRREEPFKRVQFLFLSFFENHEKITVKDVQDWGESMRWHFLMAIIATFNGKGKECIWNQYRSAKSFCGDYHLHINTVTKEDIEFLTVKEIASLPTGARKSTVYAIFEELEWFLFESKVDKNEIWDRRNVEYMGEKTLTQIERELLNYKQTILNAQTDIIKSYEKAMLMTEGKTSEGFKALEKKHAELKRMGFNEFLQYTLDEKCVT